MISQQAEIEQLKTLLTAKDREIAQLSDKWFAVRALKDTQYEAVVEAARPFVSQSAKLRAALAALDAGYAQ